MDEETEVKFKISDKEEVVSSLRERNFSMEERYRERNILFDRERELEDTDRLLRVRKIEDDSPRERLTYKGPRSEDGKSREEIELETDIGKMALIFKRLGFFPQFKYEKVREVWNRNDQEIVMDKLPFLGLYMEIEADRDEIEELASELGFKMEESITDTYMELFDRYRKKHGIEQDFLVWDSYDIEDL